MAKKLSVLFLPKWYPNKFDNLDGNFIENHAKVIANHCNLTVLFVHSDTTLKQDFELVESINENFKELRVYFKKPTCKIKTINKIATFYCYCKAQFKGYRHYLLTEKIPDISHIHVLGRTAPVALFLKIKHKVPYIISEHWSGYHKASGAYTGKLKNWLNKKVVKNAAKITTVSKNLEEAMLKHGLRGNYLTIPNSIDTETFVPDSTNKNKQTRFIHISNLSKTPKNLDLIISNLIELAQEGLEFEFVLAGYGEEEDEMLELINQSEIKSKTLFKGKLSNNEVAKELGNSDAMLLFSKYENQPMVMLEAFACGCPVVVPRVGGIEEIMNHDLGILVEAGDNEAFKAALRDIITKKISFNKTKIREFAVNKFSEKVVGQQFYKLYKTCTSE